MTSSTAELARFVTGNRPFIVVWIALFISVTGIAMVSPLLPVFAEEMGANGIWLGVAFSGFAFSQVPLMPLVGRLSDRFGKKFFLWGGLLVYAAAAGGYYWSPGYVELSLFRVLSGVGAAMVIPTAFAYVGELAPSGHEGRYMGLFNIAFIAGFGIGPLLGGVIHDGLGTDATFISMSVLSLVGFVIVYLLLPRDAPSRVGGHNTPSTSFSTLLGDRTMRAIITFQLAYGVVFGTVLAFLGVYMTTVLLTNLTLVGVAMSLRSVLNGTLSYPFGWMADRRNRVVLATLGLTMVSIGTLAIPWIGNAGILIVVFGIIGLFESMALPAVNAMTVDRGRAIGMGSVMALFNTAMSIGMVAGSLAGGLIEDYAGLGWVFRYAAILAVMGIIAFNALMKRNKVPEQ